MTSTNTAKPMPKAKTIFVPLSSLKLSPDNVRKKEPTVEDIEQLMELIAAQGLLNALQVSGASGAIRGEYEVEAGGRRFRALKLLAKKGRISADEPIECKLVEKARAVGVSLAENIGQLPMHPADQFDAFKALVDQGKSVEEVAAQHGETVLHVQRRLKMANVAPKLVNLYREGQLTLDQIMAFASVDDNERQLQVWNSLPAHSRHSHTIKNRLTEDEIPQNDPRAKAVGLKKYLAQGGTVRADLFSSEGQTQYLTDVGLVEMMLGLLLEEKAAEVREEGWSWVEIYQSYDYQLRALHCAVPKTYKPETPEIAEQRKSLEAECEKLEAEQATAEDAEDWDRSEAIDEEMDALQAQIEALKETRLNTDAIDPSTAGAVVALEGERVVVYRGLALTAEIKKQRKLEVVGGTSTPTAPAVPEKLMLNLTSHRTAAMQAMMVDNQQVALAVLATKMALSMFDIHMSASPLKISLTQPRHTLERNAPTLAGSKAATVLDAQREGWTARLPEDSETWFAWFLAQPQEVVVKMIVFATANCIEAVQSTAGGVDHSQPVARALALDMADWWEAKPETYLTLVPKAKLIEAVTETADAQVASEMLKMKKDEAVAHAAHHLAGRRWLPATLRTVEPLAA